MCCRCPIRRTASKFIENALQFIAARNDHTDTNRTQIEKQSKVIQISIIKWIFVISFNFQGNAIFKTVNFMCW